MADDHSNSSRSSSYSSSAKVSQRSRSRSDSKRRRQRSSKYSKSKQRVPRKHEITYPPLDQPMLDLGQFEEFFATSELPIERLRQHHQKYERLWENKQKDIFFEQHQDEQWIQDKYHPNQRKLFFDERCVLARSRFQDFLKIYNIGGYNQINLTINEQQMFELFELNDQYLNDEQELPFWEWTLKENVDLTKAPFFGVEPAASSLFIKSVPMSLSRVDLIAALQKLKGYLSLTLSEPQKLQNFARMAWVEFENEEACTRCLSGEGSLQVKDHVLYFLRQQDKKKTVRVFRSIDQNKLMKDLSLQRDLIKCLDKEKGITENPLIEGPLKDRDDPTFNRQLDLQTMYLRKVHSYCYWSGGEMSDTRIMVSKAGYHFLRFDTRKSSSIKWQEIAQQLCQKRVDDSAVEKSGNDLVDLEIIENALKSKPKIHSRTGATVYPCQYCEKQFEGDKFLIKHISGKHPTIYAETRKELSENIIEGYMAQLYKRERQAKATIQRQIFQESKIDDEELKAKKLTIPINFIPRLQQRTYKDLDSVAQERTQPAIISQIRETKVNYNDI